MYTLAGNLTQKYAIKIQCSNIVFDGAGYIINGTATSYAGFSNVGISLKNVTVKNVTVSGFWDAHLLLQGCFNCSVSRSGASTIRVIESTFNTISESIISGYYAGSGYNYTKFLVRFSNSNAIFRNNISGYIDIGSCNSNTFFENNFFACKLHGDNDANFWDNGSVGNYWTDYSEKYPNAPQIGDSGIGDTLM